jgi:hypothetical protein
MRGFNATYVASAADFTNLRDEPSDSMSISRGIGASSHEDDALPPPTSVAAVRSAMSNTRLAAYLAEFDNDVAGESRVLCSVPAAMVDDTARAQLLAGGVEREDDEMHHQNQLEHIDLLKRNRILELEEKRRGRRFEQVRALRSIDQMRQQTSELVETYYDHARRELDIHLTSRQGEVSQSIGEIRKYRRGDYDPDKPDWNQFEQSVQINVTEVRGLKDKIAQGNYIVLVSKWDKLGGDPLRWSTRNVDDRNPPPCPLHTEQRDTVVRHRCEICKGWAGATSPVLHNGDPRDYDLKFGDKLFTFFLPQTRVKPYNCLMFELIKLPDKTRVRRDDSEVHRPVVVGWGVIPIVDSQFNVINGRFRFPMLRGPYKPSFGHYMTVQKYLTEDLENWLGNIYVEVFPQAREHYGRNEFTLQYEFSGKLLALAKYPSAMDPRGWPFDGTKRGLSIDATHAAAVAAPGTKAVNINASTGLLNGPGFGAMEFNFEEEFPYQRPKQVQQGENEALTRWNLLRRAIIDHQRRKRQEEQQKEQEAIRRIELSKRYRYAIHPYGSTSLSSVWRIQVEYCMRAIRDELSLRHPMSFQFYLVVFVFFVSLYFQLYIHGFFVYLALVASGTPRDSVEPTWYGLDVQYVHRQTTPMIELFVVFFSMLSLYFMQLFEVSIGWVFRATTGLIPEQLSKFVYTTAGSAILVPFLEIFLDGVLLKRRSDWSRLDDFFTEHEYGAQYTAVIFIILYLFMFAGCVVSTFLYTMNLHLNGILQDSYWRIVYVNEETCHIPDDLEISVVELKHIIRKAEQWRGKNGERRKVSVQRLKMTDEEDPDYERNDVLIQVAQLNCGNTEMWKARGDYFIYREFFIQEEGYIVEVVGDKTPHGMSFTLNSIAKKLKLGVFGKGGGDAPDAGRALMALFGGKSIEGNSNSQSLAMSGLMQHPGKKKAVGFGF